MITKPSTKKVWRPVCPTEIRSTEEPEFVTLHVSGPLTAREMIAGVKKFYPELKGRAVLWDLSQGDMRRKTVEDFATLATTVAALPDSHLPRRTACYAKDHATFARFCTYMTHALHAAIPVEYCAFSDLGRARNWLTSPH